MTDSQDWWPADWGHYGPLFIRMAWHSAGTYRIADGRGGAGTATSASRRSTAGPTTSTSTRRAACCGRSSRSTARKISWADLMILAGNVALESMGFKTFGFAGGREDIWEPEEDIYWGSEAEWLGDQQRYTRRPRAGEPAGRRADGPDLREPRRPQRQARPAGLGRDIRETFARMAMDDEETVALVAGGHTFGKAHGAGRPRSWWARARSRRHREQGLGWKKRLRQRQGRATPPPAASKAPGPQPDTTWDNGYFDMLFGYEWELVQEPGRRPPVGGQGCAGAHDPRRARPVEKHQPMMTTADLSLRFDPAYERSRAASWRTRRRLPMPSPAPGSS
jgi:catalase-peroxidase